jgi:hypothetical protein
MNREIEILKRIHDLPVPRDLNPLPEWADPYVIETLINRGYLTCFDSVRDEQGVFCMIVRAELTESGRRLLMPQDIAKSSVPWDRIAAIAAAITVILGAIKVIMDYVAKRP